MTTIVRITIAIVYMVMYFIVPVVAAPFSLTGDFTHQVQRTAYQDNSFANNIETTMRVYADWSIGGKATLFGRYGYQHFGGDERNFAALYKLDQYGMRWFPDKHTRLAIGKQGAYMGVYGGLLSTGGTVGQGMLKGLDLQHTTNDNIVHMVAGRFDKRLFGSVEDRPVYGLDFSTKLGTDRITVGYLSIKDTVQNYCSLGLVHPVGKAQFMAEYVFSAAKEQNEGLIYGVSYSLGDNDGISITTHNLKAQASPVGVGGYTNNTASTVAAWGHSWPEGYVSVSYEKVHSLSDNSRYNTTTMAYIKYW